MVEGGGGWWRVVEGDGGWWRGVGGTFLIFNLQDPDPNGRSLTRTWTGDTGDNKILGKNGLLYL